MDIKDTIELMRSDDYKDRFKAEFYQTKIRLEKLNEMLDKWNNGELKFTPKSPQSLFLSQKKAMCEYIACLEIRATIDGIEL